MFIRSILVKFRIKKAGIIGICSIQLIKSILIILASQLLKLELNDQLLCLWKMTFLILKIGSAGYVLLCLQSHVAQILKLFLRWEVIATLTKLIVFSAKLFTIKANRLPQSNKLKFSSDWLILAGLKRILH